MTLDMCLYVNGQVCQLHHNCDNEQEPKTPPFHVCSVHVLLPHKLTKFGCYKVRGDWIITSSESHPSFDVLLIHFGYGGIYKI